MERGKIINVNFSNERGITLNTVDSMTEVLHYDFRTEWYMTEDLEIVGCSDSIYKCMYEMMM